MKAASTPASGASSSQPCQHSAGARLEDGDSTTARPASHGGGGAEQAARCNWEAYSQEILDALD